ncbi:MAG: hypothetical protein AVDCRST_MAG73-883, partial [uncultured Thermomicrobiales bacterium]
DDVEPRSDPGGACPVLPRRRGPLACPWVAPDPGRAASAPAKHGAGRGTDAAG